MPKQYIVRLISSEDHDMPKQELIKQIRETGRDRYDVNRKPIFDDFYGKYKVDFFGTLVEATDLNKSISKMKNEFAEKTHGDRDRKITPDIALIYKADRCRMVQRVYEDQLASDCFQFLGNPKEALEEVREI